MMEEVRKMQNLTGEFVGTVMANALKWANQMPV